MGEESHLDEMRSAIRGDFARLAERRGEQELMRVSPDPGDDAPVQGAVPAEPRVACEPEREPDAVPRRGWLARLVSP